MKLTEYLLQLLFPPKCVLCGKLLGRDETDLCRSCRVQTPAFTERKIRLSFLAGWTALWYYMGDVRHSMLQYKFRNARGHAECYGKMLAMKLRSQELFTPDILTWVPVSRARLRERGYDQVELIGQVVARELQMPLTPTLKKIRNNPPQSGIVGTAQRKANVLGVYRVLDPEIIRGRKILLLDDIITTGATASECARVLLTAGAGEVFCAAVAAAPHDRKPGPLNNNVGECNATDFS